MMALAIVEGSMSFETTLLQDFPVLPCGTTSAVHSAQSCCVHEKHGARSVQNFRNFCLLPT